MLRIQICGVAHEACCLIVLYFFSLLFKWDYTCFMSLKNYVDFLSATSLKCLNCLSSPGFLLPFVSFMTQVVSMVRIERIVVYVLVYVLVLELNGHVLS